MKKVWFWIRLGLSILMVAILLFGIDLKGFSTSLSDIKLNFLLVAFMLALFDRVIMAYKWSILLRVKAIQIPLPKLTGIYLISTFLGLFLPATVGSDAVRAFAVSRQGYKGRDVVSSIVLERLLGIIALLIFMLISIVISLNLFGKNFFDSVSHLFWVGLGLFLALLFLMMISLNKTILHGGISIISKWNRKGTENRIAEKLKETYSSYLSYQDHKPALSFFLALTFVENLAPILVSFFLSLSFSMHIPLLYFFILIPIVLVLVRLPISLDGVGIQEGAFVYFFTLMGMLNSDALLLGVATHVMALISVLPGGILYGLNGLSLKADMVEHP